MSQADSLIIRPMEARDAEAADRVHRLAFGTFFGLPDPSKFRGDAEVVRTRLRADPATAVVADLDGEVVASGLGMDWGSVFIVGPITVRPDLWSRGIARTLMAAMDELIAARPVTLAALFTHPASTRHIRLYESFGYTTQFLTAVMSKPVEASKRAVVPHDLYSSLSPAAQTAALAGCRRVSKAVYRRLDLGREIQAAAAQGIGETVLLHSDGEIGGFAVCHAGAGSEAGSKRLFVKFACVRPGAADDFERLLDACEALAAAKGAERIIAGTNAGRRVAYQTMQRRGYRADMNGLAMHRPDQPGYNRPDVFAIDDWR